jgi:hypothetical protein
MTSVEDYIARVVAEAPPLTQSQIGRLRVLLFPSDPGPDRAPTVHGRAEPCTHETSGKSP